MPSEEALLADADTVLRFIAQEMDAPLARVVVLGRSIGATAAIYLASAARPQSCSGLILTFF